MIEAAKKYAKHKSWEIIIAIAVETEECHLYHPENKTEGRKIIPAGSTRDEMYSNLTTIIEKFSEATMDFRRRKKQSLAAEAENTYTLVNTQNNNIYRMLQPEPRSLQDLMHKYFLYNKPNEEKHEEEEKPNENRTAKHEQTEAPTEDEREEIEQLFDDISATAEITWRKKFRDPEIQLMHEQFREASTWKTNEGEVPIKVATKISKQLDINRNEAWKQITRTIKHLLTISKNGTGAGFYDGKKKMTIELRPVSMSATSWTRINGTWTFPELIRTVGDHYETEKLAMNHIISIA